MPTNLSASKKLFTECNRLGTYRLMSWERPLFHAELLVADVAVELPADTSTSPGLPI